MALNPFFLQGSSGEQRLVQELINEQLKIYGVEVVYLPRKIVNRDSIFREIQSSKFDDNFLIEAYVNTYDGYGGAGDIMTKFGVSLRDELSITISKERFEDFIAVFLDDIETGEINVAARPREGDLIYFPLGQRIFEVKFVEHEKPFYQLGQTYVYELQCELFEYEDEMGGWDNLNTTTEEIDNTLVDQGFIISLKVVPSGTTATATANIGSGYVRKIFLNNDGYGYTGIPNVAITPAPAGGIDATAVAITTSIGGVHSVKEILLTNAGSGYVEIPTITITGGGGVGAAATCSLVTDKKGVVSFTINDGGVGYTTTPSVSISLPPLSPQLPASAKAIVGSDGTITELRIVDAGSGYFTNPSVIIGSASTVGFGTYWFNEVIIGSVSGASARIKSWDATSNIIKVGPTNGDFVAGDIVVGEKSNATYSISGIVTSKYEDKYEQNDTIQEEAELIVDFTESNPFGTY